VFGRIYNKILDRDWFSTPVFVKESVRDHVIIFIIIVIVIVIVIIVIIVMTLSVPRSEQFSESEARGKL